MAAFVVTSPDGITWTSHSVTGENWLRVSRGSANWIAAGRTPGLDIKISISTDAFTWVDGDIPEGAGDRVWDMIYGGGKYIISGELAYYFSTDDGANWTQSLSADIGLILAYGDGVYVDIGLTNSLDEGEISVRVSTDAITWVLSTPAEIQDYAYALKYLNGQFVALIRTGADVSAVTSPDGETWTIQGVAYPTADGGASITYVSGFYYVLTFIGNVYRSTDLVTWTDIEATMVGDGVWKGLAFGEGLLVAISTAGAIATSPDGITWTARPNPLDTFIMQDIEYG